MNDQLPGIAKEFPDFIRDYGKLFSYFQTEFESLSAKEKGDRFADFAQRLVPHTEIGREFNRPQKSQKQTHDEGIDLSCGSKDGTRVLYTQAKYTIPGVDEIDEIMSKFSSYQEKQQAEHQIKLIPEPGAEKPPVSHFMIVTVTNLAVILHKYGSSRRTGVGFLKRLEAEQRLHIVDGPSVLSLLQETYRKSYMLPSEVRLSFAKPFINLGNVYVGILDAGELIRLYGEFGDALFLENIREFLGPTSGRVKAGRERITVNEAIAKTIAQAPGQFLARNNGITLRANSIDVEGETTLILHDASVVNGCQTTMSIVQNPRENCYVLVKIVQSSDSWDIAEAANFQNQIDQIALKLARYIRPQKIREAAIKFSVRFKGQEESSPFAVLDSIYQQEITEEEFRALFLGLFSSSPRNALAVNYTEVNVEVVDRLFSNENPDKEIVQDVLFRISQLMQDAARELENALRNQEELFDLFQRFWREDRPNYRAFLAILAASGCARVDVYSKAGHPTYEDMMSFLDRVRIVVDRNPGAFLMYYRLAFTCVAIEVIGLKLPREETLQRMRTTIEESNFTNLYLKVQAMATTMYPPTDSQN